MLIAPHTIPHQTTSFERTDKVLRQLLKGPYTTAELAFDTGLSHADAARAIHELSAKQHIYTDPVGVIDANTGFTKKKHHLTQEGRRAALRLPNVGDQVMAKPFPPNRALAGLRHIDGVAGKFDFSKIEKKLHGSRGLTYSGTGEDWRDARQVAMALNLKTPNSTIFNNLAELEKLGLLEMEEREYDEPGKTRTNKRRCYRRVQLDQPIDIETDDDDTPPAKAKAAEPTPPALQPATPPPSVHLEPPRSAWSRDDLEKVLDQFDPMDVLMAALARLEKEVKDHRTFAAAVAKLKVPM